MAFYRLLVPGVLTEGMHSHKAVMSLLTPALKPLGTHSNTYLPVLAHSLHHWPEKGDIKAWCLVSQPAYSLLILIYLYILSSRAVGPQKSENLHTNCLTAGAHQMPGVSLNSREQNLLFSNEEEH